jgi:hypothetical protein
MTGPQWLEPSVRLTDNDPEAATVFRAVSVHPQRKLISHSLAVTDDDARREFCGGSRISDCRSGFRSLKPSGLSRRHKKVQTVTMARLPEGQRVYCRRASVDASVDMVEVLPENLALRRLPHSHPLTSFQ